EPAEPAGERAAEYAFLYPRIALADLAVGGEAGELGTRARAARRAIVGLARAHDEVARIRFRGARRREELDVIDVGMSCRIQRLPDAPAVVGQRVDVAERELLSVLGDEEEPVATPRHVAGDAANARHVHRHRLGFPKARDVGERDFSIRVEA